jgi:hypothetical protein
MYATMSNSSSSSSNHVNAFVASNSSSGTINNASNPASALVASARPPLPLAPRLTTASSSHQGNMSSLPAYLSSQNATEPSSHARPRQLIHHASQSVTTQALDVETAPPATRFPAYIPSQSRSRMYASTSRIGEDGGGLGLNSPKRFMHMHGVDSSSTTHGFRSSEKMDTLTQKGESSPDGDTFEVLPQFRSDADYPGEVLVRCTGSDFYVHRA